MRIQEIEEICRNVSFAPMLRITAAPVFLGGTVQLAIDGVVQDSNDPERRIRIRYSRQFHLAEFRDEKTALIMIQYLVRDYVEHEMAEWLKYKGVRLRDPHKAQR